MKFNNLPDDVIGLIQSDFFNSKEQNVMKNTNKRLRKIFNRNVETGNIPVAMSSSIKFKNISDVDWTAIDLSELYDCQKQYIRFYNDEQGRFFEDPIFSGTLYINFDLLNHRDNLENRIDIPMGYLKIRKIIIIGQTITTIGNYFLYNCPSLLSINLSSLTNVEKIGDNFLEYCSSLKSANLRNFKNVKKIGDKFLAYCSSLESINLDGFIKLETIGSGFLSECSSLKSLDMSGLCNLITINNNFLSNCSSLESLGVSKLNKIKHIYSNFLSGCSSLKSLDLNNFVYVRKIKGDFLNGCLSLESLNMEKLPIKAIESGFLRGCLSLKSLVLGNMNRKNALGDIRKIHEKIKELNREEEYPWTKQNFKIVITNNMSNRTQQKFRIIEYS
jgi:hypothetical protein